jgi:DNA-binding winged helix-turn-helix (wHTH) protein
MDAIPHGILQFDGFAVDLNRRCVRLGDREIELRPKSFQVLQFLAANAGRLVSKNELFEAVWSNVTVSDDSLVQCIREIREKLGDSGHRLIKTLPKSGYMLDATAVPSDASSARAILARIAQAEMWTLAMSEHSPAGSEAISRRIAAAIGVVSIIGIGLLVGPPSVSSLVGKGNSLDSPSKPRASFKDCDDCPEMVVLPRGEFVMGSPVYEFGRKTYEAAARHVTIVKPFAIGRFEITVEQFSAYVLETGFEPQRTCQVVAAVDRDPPTWVFSAYATFR